MRATAGEAIRAERATPSAHATLDLPFTEEEVRACLWTLKNRKAAGRDGLPVELLKCSGAAGVCALTRLFNAVYQIWVVGPDFIEQFIVSGGVLHNY